MYVPPHYIIISFLLSLNLLYLLISHDERMLTIPFFRPNRYDLKQGTLILLWVLSNIQIADHDYALGCTEISKSPVSKVPVELAKHESAQHKVSREMKRKRDADDQG